MEEQRLTLGTRWLQLWAEVQAAELKVHAYADSEGQHRKYVLQVQSRFKEGHAPRSHVLAKRDRPSEWTDLRKSPPCSDDVVIKQAIANVVKDRATYGYRCVWARLRLEGHGGVNYKRVYRVMREEGWLLYRHGEKPVDTRKHEGKVAVKESDVRWCSDGLELSCDNGEKVRAAFALDCCDREVMIWLPRPKASMRPWWVT